MPSFPDEPIVDVRRRLLDGMTNYMRGGDDDPDDVWDCGYSLDHIDRCAHILDGYLAAVPPDRHLTQEQVRAAVRQVVLDLNDLNEESGGGLIETDQREGLCQLVLVAASHAGLDTDEDITEEWREW